MKSCIVIHTLICFVEEGDKDDEFLDELVREGTDVPGHPGDVIELLGQANGESSDAQRERWGQEKRTELKRMLFESLYVLRLNRSSKEDRVSCSLLSSTLSPDRAFVQG